MSPKWKRSGFRIERSIKCHKDCCLVNGGLQCLGLTMIGQSDIHIWASIQSLGGFFSEFKAYCSWIPVSECSKNTPSISYKIGCKRHLNPVTLMHKFRLRHCLPPYFGRVWTFISGSRGTRRWALASQQKIMCALALLHQCQTSLHRPILVMSWVMCSSLKQQRWTPTVHVADWTDEEALILSKSLAACALQILNFKEQFEPQDAAVETWVVSHLLEKSH